MLDSDKTWFPGKGKQKPIKTDRLDKSSTPQQGTQSCDNRGRKSNRIISGSGTTALHEHHIQNLLASDLGIKKNGFAAAVRDLIKEIDADKDCEAVGFRPDAFKFDREAFDIVIYEVDVEYPLSVQKLELLGSFWEAWDSEGTDWLPRLVVVDRYGGQNSIDLMHAYHRSGPLASFFAAYGE